MAGNDAMSRLLKFSAPLLMIFIITFFYVNSQDIINVNQGLVWDATVYHSVSTQIVNDHSPLKGMAPFIYRIATPYLTAMLFPDKLIQGYLMINLVIALTSIIVFYFFLRLFINNSLVIFCLLAVYCVSPLGSLRFSIFYPVYADPGAVLFSLLFLYGSVIFKKVNWTTTFFLSLLRIFSHCSKPSI